MEEMKLKMVPKERCNKSGFGGCPQLRVSGLGSWMTGWHSGKRAAWLSPPILALYQVPGSPGVCLQEGVLRAGT